MIIWAQDKKSWSAAMAKNVGTEAKQLLTRFDMEDA